MAMKTGFFPALVLTAVAAAGIGFAASHLWDHGAMAKLEADRDLAWNCRHAGKEISPCPVLYRNTRIEWRDKIQTVATPDRRQAVRIASLSRELAQAQRTIRDLERPRRSMRTAAVTGRQDGTIMHPYTTDDHCPAGSVVVYDAGSRAIWHSGDPNVCYARTNLQNRLALSQHR
ncbi:MAG TPA: hypothetical protein VHT03_01870 [Rhizomicrobium sp.]|jgi:hypothetical protein|nr:hypothetical protein [Rhizomicrobium sp.]